MHVAMKLILLILVACAAHSQCKHIDNFEITDNNSDGDIDAPVNLGCGWHHCHVSFMAYLSKCQDADRGDHVKYDKFTVNDGKAYNATSGVFTAKYCGVYSFSFSVESHLGDVGVSLMVDGKPVASAVAQVKDDSMNDVHLPNCHHHHHHHDHHHDHDHDHDHHDHHHHCHGESVMGSNTAVVHVCKNKQVWVEATTESHIGGCERQRYSTFSGHLLYKRK